MEQERKIMRGDIYIYDFGNNPGSIQCGKRPVLVLQADDFNVKAPTIIVAAITTVIKRRYLPSHVILPEGTGLLQESMVLLEQIRAVNKCELEKLVGTLTDETTWKYINNSIKKTFGLWIYRLDRTGDIRSLCPNCLRDYMNNGSYIIKRLDPFCSTKGKCDKCDGMGYDYLIYDRKRFIK